MHIKGLAKCHARGVCDGALLLWLSLASPDPELHTVHRAPMIHATASICMFFVPIIHCLNP